MATVENPFCVHNIAIPDGKSQYSYFGNNRTGKENLAGSLPLVSSSISSRSLFPFRSPRLTHASPAAEFEYQKPPPAHLGGISEDLADLPIEYGTHFEIFNRDLFFHLPQRQRIYEQPASRAEINSFSQKSKKNLRHLVLNTQVKLSSMLVLTYHQLNPTGPRAKRDLNTMLKALRRQFGQDLEYIWVLEFHTRGQNAGKPHFHILLNVPAGDSYHRSKVARSWHRITGEQDPAHIRVHSHHKQWIPWEIRDHDYLSATYLSKEAQKAVPEGFAPGRFWGNSKGIPPRPKVITAETIAKWANAAAADRQQQWTAEGITAYFKLCLKKWHSRRCARHRRKSPLTFARPGAVQLNLGTRVFYQLLNWVCSHPPPIPQPQAIPF